MEIKRNWFYWLISGSVVMLLALGTWWLYLVFKLANKLSTLNHPTLEGNLISMIKWEGATFLLFLLVLTITLTYVYLLDLRKTKALQAFFSSLTHELKTPLASMKLQTEVLSDLIEGSDLQDKTKAKIETYTQRLLTDSIQLEDQLDNHLQLSRVERDSPLNLRPIEIEDFIKKEARRVKMKIEIISPSEGQMIMADDYALQTILRNLFENTRTHHPEYEVITISIKPTDSNIQISFCDGSSHFKGSSEQLGDLFYKHNSPKGSGIGLYLVRRLMFKMRGHLQIETKEKFVIDLFFQKVAE